MVSVTCAVAALIVLGVCALLPVESSASNYTVSLSDITHRRGRVILTKTSVVRQNGTMCSNMMTMPMFPGDPPMSLPSTFFQIAANVTCSAAGFPVSNGGGAFAIPNFGNTSFDSNAVVASLPILIQSVSCINGSDTSLDTCNDAYPPYTSDVAFCTHWDDAGVVCPLLRPGGGGGSSNNTMGNVSTVYTVYLPMSSYMDACQAVMGALMSFTPPDFNFTERILVSNQEQSSGVTPVIVCRLTVASLASLPTHVWSYQDSDLDYFLMRILNSTTTLNSQLYGWLFVAMEFNRSHTAYLDPAPPLFGGSGGTPAPQAGKATITALSLSDLSKRRGRILATIQNTTGTVCSGGSQFASSLFDIVAANVSCTQAGYPVAGGGAFAIPNLGLGGNDSVSNSMPVIIDSLWCSDSAAPTLNSGCSFYVGPPPSCTHEFDAGVVCPVLAAAPRRNRTGSLVTIFTVYYTVDVQYPSSTFMMLLQPLLPASAIAQIVGVDYMDRSSVTSSPLWTAFHFYVDNQPPTLSSSGQAAYTPEDIEFAMTQYVRNNVTWQTQLQCIWMTMTANMSTAAIYDAPMTPPLLPTYSPLPTSATEVIDGLSIGGWSFRLVSEALGTPATRGLVELQPPSQNGSALPWGAMCELPATPSILYAICRKALGWTQPTMPWPGGVPVLIDSTRVMTFDTLQTIRPIASDVFCMPEVNKPANSTQLVNCSFAYYPSGDAACSSSSFVAIDCNTSVVPLPSRMLTAVVPKAGWDAATFRAAWGAALQTSADSIVLGRNLSYNEFLYINMTFSDNATMPMPDGSGGSGLGPMMLEETPLGALMGGSWGSQLPPFPGGSSGSMGFVLPPYDIQDSIQFTGTSSQFLAWRASLLDAGELYQHIGIYELRDNTTVPNGDSFSLNTSSWEWRWGLEGNGETIKEALTAEEMERGIAKNGSSMVGRPELRIGGTSPWGTVTSLNASAASAAAMCAQLGAATAPASLLPFVRYGSGVVYLGDASCPSFSSTSVGPSFTSGCTFSISTKYQKKNNGAHVNDVAVYCGSIRPNIPSSSSLAVHAYGTSNDQQWPSRVLQCLSNISSVPTSRLSLNSAAVQNFTMFNRTTMLPDQGYMLTLNISIVDSGLTTSGEFSSGDFLLMINVTNEWSLKHVCGIEAVDLTLSGGGSNGTVIVPTMGPATGTSTTTTTTTTTSTMAPSITPGANTTTASPVAPTTTASPIATTSTTGQTPTTTTTTLTPMSTQSTIAPIANTTTTTTAAPVATTSTSTTTTTTTLTPRPSTNAPTANTTTTTTAAPVATTSTSTTTTTTTLTSRPSTNAPTATSNSTTTAPTAIPTTPTTAPSITTDAAPTSTMQPTEFVSTNASVETTTTVTTATTNVPSSTIIPVSPPPSTTTLSPLQSTSSMPNTSTPLPNTTMPVTRASSTTVAPTSTASVATTTTSVVPTPPPTIAASTDVQFTTLMNMTTSSLIASVMQTLNLTVAPTLISTTVNSNQQRVTVLAFNSTTTATAAVNAAQRNSIPGVLAAAALPSGTTVAPSNSTSGSSPSTGVIIGAVVGGIAGLGCLVAVVYFCKSKSGSGSSTNRRFDDDFVMAQGMQMHSLEELLVNGPEMEMRKDAVDSYADEDRFTSNNRNAKNNRDPRNLL